jgi:tetratricopeptide (TPR) repeat protein
MVPAFDSRPALQWRHQLLRRSAEAGGGSPGERRLAEEAFGRALALNPELALAHSLYAQLQVEDGRPVEGLVRLLRRAARHPGEVDLFVGLTHATRYSGLLDASLRAHARAVELDPEALTSVAYTHLQRGDYEAALAAGPAQDPSRLYALQSLGRREEARAWSASAESRTLNETISAFHRCVLATLDGDRAVAVKEGGRAVDGFPDPEGRYFVARCLSEVGAGEEALETLEGVLSDGFCCLGGLRQEPTFAALRGTTRFGALLEKAEAMRAAAEDAFVQERGPALLGVEPLLRPLSPS